MILNQFSPIHVLSFTLLPAGLFFLLFFILKGKPGKTREKILLAICCFNIILYVIYKIYQALFYDGYDFVLVYNLPLHFCNLNLLLLPLAILTRNKTLLAYQAYFGTALAFFALFAIDPSFRGQPFFEFSCLTYYYYHSMLMVIPLLFLPFKLFTPSFKQAGKAALLLLSLTLVMHGVNAVFRTTGFAPEANYFFTYGLRGDPFTDVFWSLIPYHFFFLLPAFLLFVPLIMAVTLPYHLSARKKARETKQN